jgi:hypothetical protein
MIGEPPSLPWKITTDGEGGRVHMETWTCAKQELQHVCLLHAPLFSDNSYQLPT